jgi:ATP-dependent DNA helicase
VLQCTASEMASESQDEDNAFTPPLNSSKGDSILARQERDNIIEANTKTLHDLLDKAEVYSQFLSQQLAKQTYIPDDQVAAEAQNGNKKKGRPRKPKGPSQSLQQKLDNHLSTRTGEVAVIGQPPLVTGGKLRDYQLGGVNWLIQLYENGVNGILADEMGLGKTIITIAFLAHLWGMGVKGPFLIVAPLSTLANWVKEFQKWAPSIPVVLYHGNKNERADLRTNLSRAALKRRKSAHSAQTAAPAPVAAAMPPSPSPSTSNPGTPTSSLDDDPDYEEMVIEGPSKNEAELEEAFNNNCLPVLVTSYDIAINDRKFLQVHEWKYLVVDEAHRLKNFNCKLIRELRCLHSANRLLLTGTPLQNNLTELWSLLNFILPDIFDSLENFQRWFDFSDVIDESKLSLSLKSEPAPTAPSASSNGGGDSDHQLVGKLHNILRPFLLRRLKGDVDLQIPKKREIVLYASFNPAQKAFYNAIRMRDFAQLASSTAGDKTKNVRLLNTLMQLRKACNHPFLFDDVFDQYYAKFQARTDEELDALDGTIDMSEASPVQSTTAVSNDAPLKTRRCKKRKSYKEDSDSDVDDAVLERLQEEDATLRKLEASVTSTNGPKVKRNRSAYMIFAQEARKTLTKHQQSSIDQVAKILSQKWKQLTEKEKAVYQAKADEDKQRFMQQMQAQMIVGRPDMIIQDPDTYVKALTECCGKLQLLDRMLGVLKKNGHKCLIFSQMVRVLDILEDYLDLNGHRYCRLDGSVAQKIRQAQIEEFNADPEIFCFLLTTRSGGVGINLTAADTVIIYDSDWNPQMDLQAQDRCHRIGQTKPVVVYRLITANSIESKILKRARGKLKLERLVIHKGKFKDLSSENQTVTANDLLEILKMEMSDGAVGSEQEGTISDEDLMKVLDRGRCVQMFDTDTSLVVNNQNTTTATKTEEKGGFEFIEEEASEF